MLKPIIAAAAILAIAGSSLVYAQQRSGEQDGDGGFHAEHRHYLSAEDMAAFTDARIAALKAGLELTPDQTKNWPPFEQALRDMAQLRVQRMQARQAGEQDGGATSPFDRLQRRADNMAKTSAALKHVADAGAPLYQSLNDAQKNRFTVLARILRPHHPMRAGMEGGWRQGQGPGPDGHGWGSYGRRFGQEDFGQEGNGGPDGSHMHRLMDGPGDQDSQL